MEEAVAGMDRKPEGASRTCWSIAQPNSKAVPTASMTPKQRCPAPLPPAASPFSTASAYITVSSGLSKGSDKTPHAHPKAMPMTAQSLELLSGLDDVCCDEPARPSTPQPGTPTISESNYRLPYMKSRLSATSSSETHLSDGSTCTPVPQPCTAAARGVPKCQAAGGTPKGSKIPVLSPQLPEQLQRAIRLEAARLREVARMADAVLAPSRLDFTPLRHKYTATPAAAAH